MLKWIAAYLLALLTWGGVFWSDFPGLLQGWNGADYSHCYLVLPVVGYMIWTTRARVLASVGGSPSLAT